MVYGEIIKQQKQIWHDRWGDYT